MWSSSPSCFVFTYPSTHWCTWLPAFLHDIIPHHSGSHYQTLIPPTSSSEESAMSLHLSGITWSCHHTVYLISRLHLSPGSHFDPWPLQKVGEAKNNKSIVPPPSVFNLFLHEMPPTSLWVYWHPAIERIKSLAPTSLPGGRRAADSLRSLLTAKPDSWNYSEYTAWLSDAGCFLCFCKSTTNDVAAWSVSA